MIVTILPMKITGKYTEKDLADIRNSIQRTWELGKFNIESQPNSIDCSYLLPKTIHYWFKYYPNKGVVVVKRIYFNGVVPAVITNWQATPLQQKLPAKEIFTIFIFDLLLSMEGY